MNVKIYSTPEFAYVLGVVKGDGFTRVRRGKWRSSGEIGLKVNDKDFAEAFKENLESFAGRGVKIFEKNGRHHVYLYSIHYADFIQNFNLKEVLKWDLSSKHSFLRGLFDSDGGIIGQNLENRRKAKRWLHFSNNNLEIVNIVATIFKELELKYSISKRIHSGFGSKKLQYEIKIYNLKDMFYFYNNIGFFIVRKQNKLKEVIGSYNYYPRDLFNKAKELHKKMGFRKVAEKLYISKGVAYGWLFKNNQKQILDIKEV